MEMVMQDYLEDLLEEQVVDFDDDVYSEDYCDV